MCCFGFGDTHGNAKDGIQIWSQNTSFPLPICSGACVEVFSYLGENVACSPGLGSVMSPVQSQAFVALAASTREITDGFFANKVLGTGTNSWSFCEEGALVQMDPGVIGTLLEFSVTVICTLHVRWKEYILHQVEAPAFKYDRYQ